MNLHNTEGSASSAGDPALCQMMRLVLQHVAALTERAQIRHPIIGRIAVEVCRCEHDARHFGRDCSAAPIVTAGHVFGVKQNGAATTT